MVFSEVFESFLEESPVAVMVRATLQNVMSAERLDKLFACNAVRQRPSELLFSTIVDLMGEVVCRVRPSVNAAYQARRGRLSVSINALYDKLQGIEPCVMQALLRETSRDLAAIVQATGGAWPVTLPGYRTRIADGNHLPASQRRLKEMRVVNGAPLPGHALVVLDPASMLVVDVFPCTDGHASERTLLPPLINSLQPKDLLVADRNFCTTDTLELIARQDAYFLIRQHASSLRHELLGRRRKVGRIGSGVVYEQDLQLADSFGAERVIRRITIQLDQPTVDGDEEIHVLSNLPRRQNALKLAALYRQRWTVEGAFHEIEAALNSEIHTLAYPQAALFGFCMALLAFNALSVVKAALRGAHGHEKVQAEVSSYYLADEVAATWHGMMIALPAKYWEAQFARHTPKQLAKFLLQCAQHVQLEKYRKHPRNPKPPSQPRRNRSSRHLSTQKLLNQRHTTPASAAK